MSDSTASSSVQLFTTHMKNKLREGAHRLQALRSFPCDDPPFLSVIENVIEYYETGMSLSEALATQPDFFDENYVRVIKDGNQSETLADAFASLESN